LPAAPDTLNRSDGFLSQSYAYYKAVRRSIMLEYGRKHKACIATAARHLSWRLDGRTTTSFCPVALAILRWRMKWEGVGSPKALLRAPLHGPLGIVVWLSLDAPLPDGNWSEAAMRWLTLHMFGMVCLDSFRSFLEEAQQAGAHDRILWLPFPARDFQQRTTVVLGCDRGLDPVRLRTSTFDGGHDADLSTRRFPGGAEHRRKHARQLSKNTASGNPVSGLFRTAGAAARVEVAPPPIDARENSAGSVRGPSPVLVFLSPTHIL